MNRRRRKSPTRRRWWHDALDALSVPVSRHHNRVVRIGRVAA